MFGLAREPITAMQKADVEQEKQKVAQVIAGLEKEWGRKFERSEVFPGVFSHRVLYNEIFCQIGGDILGLATRVIFIHNITNVVIYQGLLKNDVQYYMRVIKAHRRRYFAASSGLVNQLHG